MNKLWGGVLVLACAGAAFADQSTPVIFTTPFAFHLGDQLMPAGEYTVRYDTGLRGLILRSPQAVGIVFAINGVASSRGVGAAANASVVFNRYNGTSYFLSQVWHGEGRDGFQAYTAKKEKEIVTSIITAEAKPETIMILAQRR